MKTSVSQNKIAFIRLLFLILVVCFSIISWFIVNQEFVGKGYSIFIEFDSAYGIKPGTSVRFRGLVVGSVLEVSSQLNSVLALVKLNSSTMFIPKNSLVESNQTGLLNDSVIDIIPLELVSYNVESKLDPLSSTCFESKILCHLSYLQGDRGINYDDLIRATTRISQRFDDPRFFNLFYMFLHNSIEITDDFMHICNDLSNLLAVVLKKVN
uniref:Mce/MlaD domain-containing protein n=1 Tax=Hommersandiophycus borowitzkae TaxID=268573 RepID=A0A1G4NTV2_9FLOR|nr:Hypothetical protein ycf22 [Hommersandiophycus borowitzkae]SCW22121.1 Hypothetical protein ycf22 [Hommersandiophycus borowitzkae]